jgi:Mn-dependent DtxR family transcriptional regulator
MDVSTVGFVKADRHRLRILEVLKSKASSQNVSHKLRIHLPIVEKSLKELSERGLVRKEKEDYTITNDGLKILAQISRERR